MGRHRFLGFLAAARPGSWPRADFRKSCFESCGGVRKGESFAKVAILQYSASTGNGGQDPFLSTLRVYTRSYSPA